MTRTAPRSVVRISMACVLALLACVVAAQDARAASIAPALTIDTAFAPPSGVNRFDFVSGVVTDEPAAVAVDGDRIFTVGETRGVGGDAGNMGIVARRKNGTIDTSWGPQDQTPVGGLTDEGHYFVGTVDATKIKLYNSVADANAATNPIDLVATGGQGLNHKLTGDLGPVLFNPSTNVSTPDNTITLGGAHGLSTGDEVVYDIGFFSDGKHTVSLAAGTGRDFATSIAITPDHRIRLLGATDVDPGTGTNLDVMLAGLKADGTPDTTFGPNDARPVGGLVNGNHYFVAPEAPASTRFKLYPTNADALANTNVIALTNGVANGTAHTFTETPGGTPLPFNPLAGGVVSEGQDSIELGAGNNLAVGDEVIYDIGTAPSDGKFSFRAVAGATNADAGTRMLLANDAPDGGRMAIVGTRNTGTNDDMFLSLRNADGSPVAAFSDAEAGNDPGVVAFDSALPVNSTLMNDRGVDVEFLPNGNLLALTQDRTTDSASANNWQPQLQVFKASDGTLDTTFGTAGKLILDDAGWDPDTLPGAMTIYNGKIWVTGSTKVGVDQDAYLARIDLDGHNPAYRRFDMPGAFASSPSLGTPLSHGNDVTVIGGASPTLVVAGFLQSSFGIDWAAAGFRDLGGPLSAMPIGSFAVQAAGDRALVGVAPGGDDWVAVTGGLVDTNSDTSFGTARLLLDATGACDLAIEVPSPLEMIFVGGKAVPVQIKVTNAGTKACAGNISVPAPYKLGGGGTVPTGTLAAGASFTTTVPVSYAGARRPEDIATFSITATTTDNQANNNRFPVRAVFQYCDLSVRLESSVAAFPKEGSRSLEYNTRNVGTVPCRSVKLGVVSGGSRVGGVDTYTLQPGRSVTDDIRVALSASNKKAKAARVVIRGSATGDVNAANNTSTVNAAVVGVGDSNARRPGGRVRGFRGSASGAPSSKLSKKQRAVASVAVAVMKKGKGCSWLTSSAGKFRKGSCSRPVWVHATGKRRWSLKLKKALPGGSYVLQSRATIAAGFSEGTFSAGDGNKVSFRAR